VHVIDFHSHIYPEKIADKAVAHTETFYSIPMKGRGTPEELLTAGRRGGIDHFVVFSAAAVPAQAVTVNSYIASVCGPGGCGEGRCTGFGTLHPDMENPGEEIERMRALGLRGVKFHPDMQRFNIDDSRMMNLYALLEGKLPVLFHMGDYRYSSSHPARLAVVIDAFPRLTVIAAHFGGWSLFDLALEYFRERSCYLDISSSLPYLGPRRAEELIRIYGARRILFGSDYPIWDPGECLKEFLALRLSSAEQEQILSLTALELLGEVV
jgi:hypothetical protein